MFARVAGPITSKFKVLAVGVLAVGFALTAGGCNNELKEKNTALTNENQQLRATNDTLTQENGRLTSQNQELSGTVSTLNSQLAQAKTAQPMMPTGDGMGGGGGTGSRERGPRSETFEVKGDVAFASGQATLTAAGRKELDTIIASIRRNYANASILVEGYTDSDPIRKSKWGSNEALSQARADAVKQYMVTKGLSGGRIDTVGRGAANPKGSKAASRRVEIKVSR